MKALHIKNWDHLFENNKTRARLHMNYVFLPVVLEQEGYLELMENRQGAAYFGVWIALVMLAARCKNRGWFVTQTGDPASAGWIAKRTRLNTQIVQRACTILLALGWLEEVSLSGSCRLDKSSKSQGVGNEAKDEKNWTPMCPPSARQVPDKCQTSDPSNTNTNSGSNSSTPPIVPVGDLVGEKKQEASNEPPLPGLLAPVISSAPLGGFTQPPQPPPSTWQPSDQQKRFNRLYNRRDTTKWDDRELKQYKKLSPIADEDLALVERYYQDENHTKNDIRRRDLLTLLNNFQGEVDRARNFKSQNKPASLF